MKKLFLGAALTASLATGLAIADETFENDLGVTVTVLEEGSISETDGLLAFDRIFEVVSHPRCSNCHVDESNIPMWSGPSYGKTRPHGMHIDAGASRIGAETLS